MDSMKCQSAVDISDSWYQLKIKKFLKYILGEQYLLNALHVIKKMYLKEEFIVG